MKRFRVSVTLDCPSYWTEAQARKYVGKLASTPAEKGSIVSKEILPDACLLCGISRAASYEDHLGFMCEGSPSYMHQYPRLAGTDSKPSPDGTEPAKPGE